MRSIFWMCLDSWVRDQGKPRPQRMFCRPLLDFVWLQVSFTRAQWSEWGTLIPSGALGTWGCAYVFFGSSGKPSALLFCPRRFWLSELAADARLLLFVKIGKKRKPRENKLFPYRGFGRGERKSHSVELCVSQVEPWEPADVGAARKPSHNLRSLDPGARRPFSFPPSPFVTLLSRHKPNRASHLLSSVKLSIWHNFRVIEKL